MSDPLVPQVVPSVGTSPTYYSPEIGEVDARTLPRIFTNDTRCEACQGTRGIRVHYCPGCRAIGGKHFHRHCRCGAEWAERSFGHAGVDIQLGTDRYVPLCFSCGARHDDLSCMTPTCCPNPHVEYHDTHDPCDACRREPGIEG